MDREDVEQNDDLGDEQELSGPGVQNREDVKC